jgi:hypothetical protein
LAAEPSQQGHNEHLGPLARFVGGEWVVHGKWTNGEPLQARTTYEWGIANQIIKSKTYVTNPAKGQYQRYEGIFAWHPEKKSLVQYSFSFDGHLTETIVEVVDPDTIHVGWKPFESGRDTPIRQVLKFEGKDQFVWTVLMKDKDNWKKLIEATWERKGQTK